MPKETSKKQMRIYS